MLSRHEPAFLIWCTEIRMKWTSTPQNPHQARKKQEQVVKKEQLLNWDAGISAGWQKDLKNFRTSVTQVGQQVDIYISTRNASQDHWGWKTTLTFHRLRVRRISKSMELGLLSGTPCKRRLSQVYRDWNASCCSVPVGPASLISAYAIR